MPDRFRAAAVNEEIAKNGEMTVDDVAELIDLGYSYHATLAIHSERQARQRAA